MKKTLVVIVLAFAALAVLATGVAVAQSPQPTGPGYGMTMGRGTGEGPLHEYMVSAFANAFAITPTDFEARREAGKTAYQIALDLGFSADKIPAMLSTARTNALNAAVAANAITQAQADRMLSRAGGTFGQGNCDGTGQGRTGGMGRGGGWQTANP